MMLSTACAGGGAADNESTIPTSTTPSSTATIETTAPFDLSAYQLLVSSCVNKMAAITDLYVIMADYEVALWEAYDQLDTVVTADKLIQKTWEAMEGKGLSRANVEREQDAVMQIYKEIVSTDVSGSAGKALEEVFNQYFDAYLGLLTLVNSPVSEYDAFVENRDSYSTTIKSCKTKLEALFPG